MKWSFRLIRIAGTDVKVHLTFLLLVGWWALGGYQEGGWPGALRATVLLLSLFTCVLLHEFGHIAMARCGPTSFTTPTSSRARNC